MAFQLDEEAIFDVARQIDVANARSAYLKQVCGDDIALFTRVTALLEAHDRETGFLESPPVGVAATVDLSPDTTGAGLVIGKYKVMEQVGEGGMGVVYVAEQEIPIRRKVALKIIKPGMDTKEVVGRFEAERQALALMDHPHIAKVLDGGVTESGRPYFVMELVRGVPITEYCDENKLNVNQRLQLFIDVCNAIQHAHQKGVIHRDIKPSNVLVTVHDDHPVPKVIDFGVAKATNQRLTERTIYTRFQQIVGSPLYMSPEQAKQSGIDVDTRSDIYSLGVLLYQLLTGSTPFDKRRLQDAAFDEMRRIIREEEPPTPSSRISSLGETRQTVSEMRNVRPEKLHQIVRGDLDWIVMKALEKDRMRRYETPSAFAADVRRLLSNEPIEARPPTISYRLKKFIVRNRMMVTAGGLLTVVLLTASILIVASWSANVRLVREFRSELLAKAFIVAASGDDDATQHVLHRLSQAGVAERWTNVIQGQVHLYRHQNDKAILYLKRAVSLDPNNVPAHGMLAVAYNLSGAMDKYSKQMEELNRLQKASLVVTAEDYLFLGQAQIYEDPKVAQQTLDAAIRLAKSPLAFAIRAEVKAHRANDLGNLELAHEATRDAQVARAFLGNRPFVLVVDLFANYIASSLAKEKGEPTSSFVTTMAATATAFDSFPEYGIGRLVRAHYYEFVGQFSKAEEDWRSAANHDRSCVMQLGYAAFRWSRGHYSTTKLLRRAPRDQVLAVQIAEILALEPGIRKQERYEIRSRYDQAVTTRRSRGWGRDYAHIAIPEMTLRLLGQDEKAIQACKQRLKQSDYESLWERELVRFVGGESTPKELLESCKSSRRKRCIALRLLALACLNKGEIDEARKWLEQCVGLAHFSLDRMWAAALLHRLEHDARWRDNLSSRRSKS